MKSKIGKETKANFESVNSSYKLVLFWDKFHKAYKSRAFKLFQDNLSGMLIWNYSLV